MRAELFGAESVSDRGADSKHLVRVEAEIVLDVIVVSLRADKEVTPNPIANASADIFHEVIAAGVVDATPVDVARTKKVEAVAGNADAAHEVEASSLAQLRLEERVDVSQNGAVGFVTIIAGLPISPGTFDVEAEAVLSAQGDDIRADADIGTIVFRRWLEGRRIAEGRGGHESCTAEQDVDLLLGRGEVGKQQNRTRGCEQPEFFQYSPLSVRSG
jgi:hypothetical protein